MATSTITVKTGGEWVKFDTLGYTFENGKEYTLQVLGSAKFGDDGKNGILIDNSEPYTFTKKSGVDLYVLTNDSTVITVSDKITLGLATKGGSGGGSGAAVWGEITGTLADQTDLATALAAKQDVLTAGTGISISDNVISATGGGGTPTSILDARTETAIRLWTGNQTQYNNGGSTTFYNWQYTSSGGSWTSETSGVNVNLMGITYGNNKYIAVGGSGTILSSTDGSTWTPETSGVSAGLLGVTYGNNKYIAVGDVILSSTDGSSWTQVSSTGANGVAYGNNKFIAVGASGTILSSSDGNTWTPETSGTSDTLMAVTYGNNTFIAVGYEKFGKAAIYSSSDGSTWTKETLPSGASYLLQAVTYGNNKFVAVGSDYGLIMSSSDGSTWTVESKDVYQALRGIAYGNNKYITVGEANIITSSDGSTWTSVSQMTGEYKNITYGNNKFIVVGNDGVILSYSDGQTLSCYTTDENPTTSSVVYDNTTTQSALTITAVGTGTITLSDTNTYSYNSAGNQTVTQTIGQAHPDWLCFIENVGIKMGNVSFIPTVDQTYDATSANAQSGVAVASGISDTLGTIETALQGV